MRPFSRALFLPPASTILFARAPRVVGEQAKSSLNDESVDMLQEILDDDEGMAKQVVEAAKTSMGYDISDVDMNNVQTFADRVINLEEYRQRLREYLNSRMHSVAPQQEKLPKKKTPFI